MSGASLGRGDERDVWGEPWERERGGCLGESWGRRRAGCLGESEGVMKARRGGAVGSESERVVMAIVVVLVMEERGSLWTVLMDAGAE